VGAWPDGRAKIRWVPSDDRCRGSRDADQRGALQQGCRERPDMPERIPGKAREDMATQPFDHGPRDRQEDEAAVAAIEPRPARPGRARRPRQGRGRSFPSRRRAAGSVRERLGTLYPPHRSRPMASRVLPSTRELARHITRAVYESSDGQPGCWRMLSSIPGATAASVLYAKEQGWIELEGARSACLTEEGRKLIAREAH
jgi:hypothetical protein